MDDEVARRGQQLREVRVGGVEGSAADRAIAPAAVPGLQELVDGMPPGPREEQLELHRAQPALAAGPFGEVDQRPAHTGAALLGSRDQHPELARVVGDVVDVDAADEPAVPGDDGDLAAADELGDLGTPSCG